MKKFILLLILISFKSYSQTTFDFNSNTSTVYNNTTGFTEVAQTLNGLTINLSAQNGDVSISNGKVVSTHDWIYFNFNSNVKLSNFSFDVTQTNGLKIKMYDVNGTEFPARSNVGISGAQSDNIYSNTITNDYISKVFIDFNNLGFAFNYVTITDNQLGINNFREYETSIYPNPVKDILYIESNYGRMNVIIYNVLGEKILSKNLSTYIDLSSLNSGIYIAKWCNKEKCVSKKIIKY